MKKLLFISTLFLFLSLCLNAQVGAFGVIVPDASAPDTTYSDSAFFNANSTAQSLTTTIGGKVYTLNDWSGQPHLAIRTATDATTGIGISSVNTSYWTVFGGATINQTGGEDNNDGNGFLWGSASAIRSNKFSYNPTYTAGQENVEFNGLTPGAKYNIEIMASRDATAVTTSTREMRAICVDANGSETVTGFDVKGNTSRKISFTGKVADGSGKIKVWVGGVDNTSDQYRFGYFNVGLIYKMTITP